MRNKIWIRLLAGLFSIALMVSLIPMRTAHAETTLATGYVNTTKLNLRKGVGTSHSVVDTLSKNTAVNIYEVIGTWLRIDVPSTGKSGYVSGKYISVNNTSLSAYALGSTSGRVNLRKEATSKSESLAIVASKAGLTIYSADAKSGWYKVKVHATGKEGFISPNYVSIVSKVEGAVSGSTTATAGEITANSVNLRSGPGTNYTKLDKLQKMDDLTILEKSGDWYKVTAIAINKTGYVYASFVKVTSTSPTATPGPTTPTPVPTAIPAGTQIGKLNASGVNFRNGPSTSYSSMGKLAKDTAVTVTGRSGDWYQVTVSATGKSGYVYATYITITSTSTAGATPTPVPTTLPVGTQIGKLNAGGVNFRTGPSTSYSSMGKLAKDTAVTVTGKSGDWYQVTVTATGKSGYVFAKYVTITSTVTPTPTPTPTASVSPTVVPTTAPTVTPASPTPTSPASASPTPVTPSPESPSPSTPTPTSSATSGS